MRNYHEPEDKGILFFSSPSPAFFAHLSDAGVRDFLASYHYIRKGKSAFREWLIKIKEDGGYFMTDSGVFSIIMAMGKRARDPKTETAEYWVPYVEEYVQYLWDNLDVIYVCANMDLDNLVGRDVVDKWNEKYFRPLEARTNVIYLAHKDAFYQFGDPTGMKRLREYCKAFDYVGVNNNWSKDVSKVYSIAKQHGTRIHGFALTSQKDMVSWPFFSHDSSTWSVGLQYGSTFRAVGKRVWRVEKDYKWQRKAGAVRLKKGGVDFDALMEDERRAVNMMNALAWIEIRKKYLRSANTKLWNNPAKSYDMRDKL